MTLTLAVFCHNFEHRFCWMLSSLLQQKPCGVQLTVDVGYVRGTGSPSCAQVLDFFEGQGLRVKHTAYDKADTHLYQRRGLVRNAQLEACDTEWITFGDCDMGVRSAILETIETIIQSLSPAHAKMMLTCARYSTVKPSDATDALIGEHTYPCVVPDAFDRAWALPKSKKSNIGAGYCQIANVANVRENHKGLYVDPDRNRDYDWHKFWKTKSDRRFRSMLGRLRVPLPPFIHYQHVRDNEIGHHIEVQR